VNKRWQSGCDERRRCNTCGGVLSSSPERPGTAFTLIELLVVIVRIFDLSEAVVVVKHLVATRRRSAA